jgi:protein-S-isoprenylcysteine O-methyltransferase Ste14
MTAFLLEAAFGVFAVGLRWWVHWRRTGDSPFRGGAGMSGVTAMVVLSAVLVVPPVLDVTGAVPRLVHGGWVSALGFALALAGVAATVWSQFAMGESWRIGVDNTERTALVTAGPFRWVRNPIYTSMVLFAAGIGLLVPNIAALVAFGLVAGALEYHVRAVEEPYLSGLHGPEYRRYAAGAGRFLPGVGRLA